MNNEISIIGLVITLLNVSILFLLSYNLVKCYLCATNIDKAQSKTDVDFYFLQMLATMIFFIANAIALYTGILSFLIKPYTQLTDIVWWRLLDRTGMLATSIVLIWQRTKYNPFTS